MKRYILPFCENNDPDWKEIPVAEMQSCFYPTEDGTTASAQLCWNPEWIKLRFSSVEPNILCRFQGQCDPVWTDSCFEFFFSPVPGETAYVNLECNPNGAMFWGFGNGREDRIRLVPDQIGELFHPKVVCTEDGWELYLTVPKTVIQRIFPGFELRKGLCFRGNLYKCAEEKQPPHSLMWSPITNGKRDFHQPEFFGEFVLG